MVSAKTRRRRGEGLVRESKAASVVPHTVPEGLRARCAEASRGRRSPFHSPEPSWLCRDCRSSATFKSCSNCHLAHGGCGRRAAWPVDCGLSWGSCLGVVDGTTCARWNDSMPDEERREEYPAQQPIPKADALDRTCDRSVDGAHQVRPTAGTPAVAPAVRRADVSRFDKGLGPGGAGGFSRRTMSGGSSTRRRHTSTRSVSPCSRTPSQPSAFAAVRRRQRSGLRAVRLRGGPDGYGPPAATAGQPSPDSGLAQP